MELVYMDGKKEPYTTSEIIAECAEVQHHTITRLIRENKADFADHLSKKYRKNTAIQTESSQSIF